MNNYAELDLKQEVVVNDAWDSRVIDSQPLYSWTWKQRTLTHNSQPLYSWTWKQRALTHNTLQVIKTIGTKMLSTPSLEKNEKCIADSGYNGQPDKCVVVNDGHSSEFKEFAARAKNRQETVNWCLKRFSILRQRFRHGVGTQDRMRLHKMVVEATAGIVQYDFKHGHPPFEVWWC